MRIIAGRWRGRPIAAPAGPNTRPSADRLRQTLFDLLRHASWCETDPIGGARVLDVFAGSGALGLEALSRGARDVTFIERDAAALAALGRNIASLKGEALVLSCDVAAVPRGHPCGLIFLDPPYQGGAAAIDAALRVLGGRGWIAPDALIVAETARDDAMAPDGVLDTRMIGAGRLTFWRQPRVPR